MVVQDTVSCGSLEGQRELIDFIVQKLHVEIPLEERTQNFPFCEFVVKPEVLLIIGTLLEKLTSLHKFCLGLDRGRVKTYWRDSIGLRYDSHELWAEVDCPIEYQFSQPLIFYFINDFVLDNNEKLEDEDYLLDNESNYLNEDFEDEDDTHLEQSLKIIGWALHQTKATRFKIVKGHAHKNWNLSSSKELDFIEIICTNKCGEARELNPQLPKLPFFMEKYSKRFLTIIDPKLWDFAKGVLGIVNFACSQAGVQMHSTKYQRCWDYIQEVTQLKLRKWLIDELWFDYEEPVLNAVLSELVKRIFNARWNHEIDRILDDYYVENRGKNVRKGIRTALKKKSSSRGSTTSRDSRKRKQDALVLAIEHNQCQKKQN